MHTDHSPKPTNIIHFPLPDGASSAPTRLERQLLIFRMAADLIESGAFVDHRESFTTLVMMGYPSFQVAAVIDDARQLAMQAVVSTEMTSSLP